MPQRSRTRALSRFQRVKTVETAARQGGTAVRRGRPRKVNRAGSDTRTRLLQASFDAFVEHGFERTTIEGIARRAGLTKAAIYNHFHSKDDLMLQSAQFALKTAMCQALASLPAIGGGGPAPYRARIHGAGILTDSAIARRNPHRGNAARSSARDADRVASGTGPPRYGRRRSMPFSDDRQGVFYDFAGDLSPRLAERHQSAV